MEGRKWRERLAVAGSLMAIAAVGLTGCGGATGNPGAANTPATVTTATTAAATTGAKVSANTGTADEIQASLESAGVANAGRWTREVMEYRPYDAGDSTLAQLRQELLKYNLPRTSCSGFWAPSNREPGPSAMAGPKNSCDQGSWDSGSSGALGTMLERVLARHWSTPIRLLPSFVLAIIAVVAMRPTRGAIRLARVIAIACALCAGARRRVPAARDTAPSNDTRSAAR